MTGVLQIVLEFARAESAGQPHSFRFAAQTYLMRTPGGGFEAAELPWSRALLDDLRALRGAGQAPEVVHRIGDLLRDFLAGVGWSAREQAIVAAVRDGTPIHITIRSAAAELYALPWELLALKSTGQLLGGIPGLVVRYEWPETASFPDPIPASTRRGRVLFAWSAAGGGVPASEHLAGLQQALRGRADFDPTRDVVANASFAAIAGALESARRDGPPIDAIHILCHGAAAGGTYGLALDDASEPGGRVVVDAGRMQQLLAAHAGMLRMVVLAACDSGNTGELGNHLGSVAQMIHRAGLRAVVASRFPLSTAGSTHFCAAFYAALAAPGLTLERAFLAAREALVLAPGQLDWASVQLYARAADGDTTYPLGLPTPPAITVPTPPRRPPRALLVILIILVAVALTLAVTRPWTPAPTPEPTTPVPATPSPTAPITDPTPQPTPPIVTADPPAIPDLAARPGPPTSKPRVPPTKPATPTSNGVCPQDFAAVIKKGLPAPTGGGVPPDLRVRVAVDGALSYESLGGADDYPAQARARLPRLANERLLREHAAALPCSLRLLR